MEVIKLQKGGKKLCGDGHSHMFTKKIAKDWIRWVCVKSRSEGCKDAVTIDSDVTDIPSCHIHEHSADDVVSVAKARGNMKTLAKTPK